ncbi:MAG: glycogen synthase [Myxococcales bacterium]|nr:glycogen synthase [Myxococcales bacterium]
MAGRKILMVSAEVDTLARTGGLGDVSLGLSRALVHRGEDVALVTPLYGTTRVPAGARFWDDPIFPRVGWGPHDVRRSGVLEANVQGVRVFMVANDDLFGSRRGIYGDDHGTFGDNELRFAVMSAAALEIANSLWRGPADVLHAHDWHAALSILYARTRLGEAWARVPSILSIHNLAYQGVLAGRSLDRLGLPRALFHREALEQMGNVNLLKGACAVANRISTVSPTYAREILSEPMAFGLSSFLRARARKLVGIANGIDIDLWNPATDASLMHTFDADSAGEGKRASKAAFFQEVGLDNPAAPLFACVSRLTAQKGIDIALSVVPALVARGARVFFLGTGDDDLENGLRHVAARYPGRVAARLAFDDKFARRVYGAADFMLVPSRFEPCGLTQLYAMRYGAIPVVTDVGGLHDTVEPYDAVRDTGVGFVARSPGSLDLLLACEEGLSAYRDSFGFPALVKRAMTRDHSWTHAGALYQELLYGPLSA